MQSKETVEIREKRKRIFKETVIQGELVAKSYVDLDFRKCISQHLVFYKQISHSIVERKIVVRTVSI